MLAAKYSTLSLVVTGTLLGMMIANVPAVRVGKLAAPKIPFQMVRLLAAALFARLGVAVLLGLDKLCSGFQFSIWQSTTPSVLPGSACPA
jgi:putative Ca2+/H+ antiporter (TMEM165/GDT1 family)